ncbi:MAG: SGNH/GDSL hydrolase family protein [Thermodesulfobacteriota bacterium]
MGRDRDVASISKRRRALFGAVGLTIGVVMTALFAEVGLRIYTYYASERDVPLQIQDRDEIDYQTPGYFAPSQVITHRLYDPQLTDCYEWRTTINNLGFVSRFDYDRQKAPGVLRIAVIGDSFTACYNSDITWPDELQVLLNSDSELKTSYNCENFEVMNFGCPAFSISHFPIAYLLKAGAFSPDIIIYNFITDDLYRPHRRWDFHLKHRVRSARGDHAPDASDENPYWDDGEVRARLFCVPKQVKPFDVFSSQCHLTMGWVISSSELVHDAEERRMLRDRVMTAYLRGRFSNMKTSYLWHLLRYKMIWRSYVDVVNYHLTGEEQAWDAVYEGVVAFEMMRNSGARTFVCHNPVLNPGRNAVADEWGPQGPPILREVIALSTSMRDLEPFQIDLMSQHLPMGCSLEELRTWFNLPHDGHWSNKGVKVYARAMHNLIRSHNGLERIHSRGPSEAWARQSKQVHSGPSCP